jgi:transcriptional regulator with XRE-family HTH domain
MTAGDLAALVGCSVAYISRVEHSHENPSPRFRRLVCEALGVELEGILFPEVPA